MNLHHAIRMRGLKHLSPFNICRKSNNRSSDWPNVIHHMIRTYRITKSSEDKESKKKHCDRSNQMKNRGKQKHWLKGFFQYVCHQLFLSQYHCGKHDIQSKSKKDQVFKQNKYNIGHGRTHDDGFCFSNNSLIVSTTFAGCGTAKNSILGMSPPSV